MSCPDPSLTQVLESEDVAVSIVIPCYNNACFIGQAIESALQQNYPATEIIVIDDGSTDGSLEIISSFGRRIRWESGTNRGAPTARNRGLALAQGKYIKFLDADDILLPDCLTRQVTQSIRLPQEYKAVVYGDALWIDQQGQFLPGYKHRPYMSEESPVAYILEHSPLTSCPLHKREYLLEIGGFDPSIPKGQEHDLHLRLVLAGVKFIYHSGAVYQYREHNSEGRISHVSYDQKRALAHFETLQRHCTLIQTQTGKPLSPVIRQILARRFWAYGRSVLRSGLTETAEKFFATARELDAKNCIAGSVAYRGLARFLSPQHVETIMQSVKSLR